MRFVSAFLALLIATTTACAAQPKNQKEIKIPKEYSLWLDDTKKDMIERGISKKTIKKAFYRNYYHPSPEVVKIDKKQLEFTTTSSEYLNRIVNEKRVASARTKYQSLYPMFKDVEEKYGVGFHYLIAFWGAETNFGQTFGNFEVIDALTTLAYDKRRRKFFTEELYQALKIIDTYDIDPKQMEGSWAGAMGNFQFMPSTFNAYAVDYDGDNRIDIWHSFGDAVASAANYLNSIGWQKDAEWGCEVSLDWDFDYAQTGRGNTKPIRDWKKLGVRTIDNKELKFDDGDSAAIITPEGRKGRAYLVMNNFYKIMMWNHSENYALAIGNLADYIKSDKAYKPFDSASAVRVKTDDILEIQKFINKHGLGKVDEDGNLGSQTRAAIKSVQKAAKMPQDGYPDYQLLQRIKTYSPNVGFSVPVQPRKLHK